MKGYFDGANLWSLTPEWLRRFDSLEVARLAAGLRRVLLHFPWRATLVCHFSCACESGKPPTKKAATGPQFVKLAQFGSADNPTKSFPVHSK
jgi:hypothetical protein